MSETTESEKVLSLEEFAALASREGIGTGWGDRLLRDYIKALRKVRRYQQRQAKHDAQLRAHKNTVKFYQDRVGNMAYENFQLRLQVGRLESKLNEQTNNGGGVQDTAGHGDS